MDAGPILLFDGDCALCVRSVRFVLRHERRRVRTPLLRFAPLQGAMGHAVRRQFPALDGVDSVVWYTNGGVVTRSAAVLSILRYLGGPWRVLAAVGSLIPTGLRDRLYDLVARSRRRLFGAGCLIPSPTERARVLP